MAIPDKLLRKIENGREYRTMTMSVRAAGDDNGEMIVEGYATTFNQPYLLYDWRDYSLMEQIPPGCL